MLASRRDVLRIGTVAVAAGDFPPVTAARRPLVRAVILQFIGGGPSHIDLFDLKPDAPAEVRDRQGRPFPACDGPPIARAYTG